MTQRPSHSFRRHRSVSVSILLLGWVLALPGVSWADVESIRERLTESEDENRLAVPTTVDFFDQPLALSGQYEVTLNRLEQVPDADSLDFDGSERVLMEQELETELFFSKGRVSIFGQGRFGLQRDYSNQRSRELRSSYFERGELWLLVEDTFLEGMDFEIGRLEFEDDRLWWWDGELDAARLTYARDDVEISVALAYEVAPTRSDLRFIDPEQKDRLRLISELSWDYAEQHGIELFALFDSDRSETESIGSLLSLEQEDESDGRFVWLGSRAMGGFELGARGILGYWLDAAIVQGRERRLEFADSIDGWSEVEDVETRDVSGWAFDVGLTYIYPTRHEPRITLGYAMGSGSRLDSDGSDRSFRQTGLHGNEMAFGGVQRFGQYGRLLAPELSNLRIGTLGLGVSVLDSSSLDLVYHHYRLVEPADELRDAQLETSLDGRHRSLGHGFDLVLAIEESERVEIELSGSGFRTGSAFGRNESRWVYGAFAAIRVAF